jgi:nucleotide-binding universal stress UspA family protein
MTDLEQGRVSPARSLTQPCDEAKEPPMNIKTETSVGAMSLTPGQTLTTLTGNDFPNVIERIVAVTDLSDDSRQAVTVAANLANKFNAKLVLLCVHEPPYFSSADEAGRVDELATREKAELFALAARTRESCPDTEPVFRVGAPLAQIVLGATDWSADLLVLSGSQPEATLAPRISHYAPCPVLIVGS